MWQRDSSQGLSYSNHFQLVKDHAVLMRMCGKYRKLAGHIIDSIFYIFPILIKIKISNANAIKIFESLIIHYLRNYVNTDKSVHTNISQIQFLLVYRLDITFWQSAKAVLPCPRDNLWVLIVAVDIKPTTQHSVSAQLW